MTSVIPVSMYIFFLTIFLAGITIPVIFLVRNEHSLRAVPTAVPISIGAAKPTVEPTAIPMAFVTAVPTEIPTTEPTVSKPVWHETRDHCSSDLIQYSNITFEFNDTSPKKIYFFEWIHFRQNDPNTDSQSVYFIDCEGVSQVSQGDNHLIYQRLNTTFPVLPLVDGVSTVPGRVMEYLMLFNTPVLSVELQLSIEKPYKSLAPYWCLRGEESIILENDFFDCQGNQENIPINIENDIITFNFSRFGTQLERVYVIIKENLDDLPQTTSFPTSFPTLPQLIPTLNHTDDFNNNENNLCLKGVVEESVLIINADNINAHFAVFDVHEFNESEPVFNVCSSHFDVLNSTNTFEIQVLNTSISTNVDEKHIVQYNVFNASPMNSVSLTVTQPFETNEYWCYTQNLEKRYLYVSNNCHSIDAFPVMNSTIVSVHNNSGGQITFEIGVPDGISLIDIELVEKKA